MNTPLVKTLVEKIESSQTAHEAESWSEALRNVLVAIGISENLKIDGIRQCLGQTYQD